MELARRNNGFRKVAKWIVGAVVVAGAASGNVLCDEVSEPQEAELGDVAPIVSVSEEIKTDVKDSMKGDGNVDQADITPKNHGNASDEKVAAIAQELKLSREPEAVVFVTSLGREYTNKEIDNLIDRTNLTGTNGVIQDESGAGKSQFKRFIDDLLDRTGLSCTKGVIRHMLGVRRAELLREMDKFNTILESLPKEIAEEAGKYPTYDRLPADLAEKVKRSHLNTTTFGLLEKVPQNLADEMMRCDIYEGFPGELIDKINAFLHPFDPSTVINDKEDDGKRVGGGTPAAPPTPVISGSTEVTKEGKKTKAAIKEEDDSVKEGKESKEGEE